MQTNDVQAMLLHSGSVSEINFLAIWRSKIQKSSLSCPPWEHFMEMVIQANNKETHSLAKNSCRQKCLDKSLAILFPFALLTDQKVKISKQWKKAWRYHLNKCTKNHHHILHCSRDIAGVGCNCYFSFWVTFSPLTSLKSQKMKLSQKWKKKTPGGINIYHKCTKNHDHVLYYSWDMAPDGCSC